MGYYIIKVSMWNISRSDWNLESLRNGWDIEYTRNGWNMVFIQNLSIDMSRGELNGKDAVKGY